MINCNIANAVTPEIRAKGVRGAQLLRAVHFRVRGVHRGERVRCNAARRLA